jgi:hypothetical protein
VRTRAEDDADIHLAAIEIMRRVGRIDDVQLPAVAGDRFLAQ